MSSKFMICTEMFRHRKKRKNSKIRVIIFLFVMIQITFIFIVSGRSSPFAAGPALAFQVNSLSIHQLDPKNTMLKFGENKPGLAMSTMMPPPDIDPNQPSNLNRIHPNHDRTSHKNLPPAPKLPKRRRGRPRKSNQALPFDKVTEGQRLSVTQEAGENGALSVYLEQNSTSLIENLGLVDLQDLNNTMRHKLNLVLVEKIQQMKYLEQVRNELIAEAGYPPSVDAWAQAARLSSTDLRDRLVTGQGAKQLLLLVNRPLLELVVSRYRRAQTSQKDFLQEAAMGLLRAAELYQPDQGAEFLTYASHFVRAGAYQALVQNERTVRLPVQVFSGVTKYQNTKNDMSSITDGKPSLEDIAEKMGVPKATARKIQLANKSSFVQSFEAKILPDSETPWEQLIKDPGPAEKVSEAADEFKLGVYQLLSCLEPREREMVMMKFGFGTGKSVPLKQIARSFGVSKERAKATIEKALLKLKKSAREFQTLQEYPVTQEESSQSITDSGLRDIGIGD